MAFGVKKITTDISVDILTEVKPWTLPLASMRVKYVSATYSQPE